MTDKTNTYALLAQDSYKKHELNQFVVINGIDYKIFDQANNPITGYQGVAYQRVGSDDIIVAHRGTEQIVRDGIMTDGGMVFTGMNLQTPDALAFTEQVLKEAKADADANHRPLNVTVTGHSLGGTLAEITAYKYGLHGETFNAYGAAGLMQGIPEGGSQVIDHVRATDVVSAASRHFGTVHIYAVQEDIDHLQKAGYRDDGGLLSPRNPLKAVDLGAHGIDNFVPDSKLLGHSIISPENEARYRAHHDMIDRYRNDVLDMRTGLSATWEVPMTVGEKIVEGAQVIEHGAQHVTHVIGEEGSQAAHAAERAAQAVAVEASHAYEATRQGVVHSAQAAGHAVAQGAHAVEHAVSQGVHATEHAAHTLANDASQVWNMLSHPGSWFDSKPGDPSTTSPHLDQTAHPDHALYEQARSAVHRLDATHQREPDQHSDNLAAALVVAARRDGLSQIHHAVLSDDASHTFAVQGELNSPLRQLTHVHTVQAVNTPIEQSSLAWQQVASSRQEHAQTQQPVSHLQEQQAQRTHPSAGM
jgi:Lipase (class 3)